MSSLGPSDSASQQPIFDFETAINRILNCVEPSSVRPDFLDATVLWFNYECHTDKMAGDIFSPSNLCQPKMHLAIHHWDGKAISSPKYNNIQRSADIYTKHLIKLARTHLNSRTDITKLPTKSDIKKWFNAKYSQAILNLEKDQKLLHLCAGHWKADTMLGQAIARSNVTESKHAKAHENVVSSDQFPMPDPSEPLIPTPFLQAVASLNVAKRALELSPGPKSPSASHIQKRSKDEAAVSGQKTNAPYVPSNRKPFFPQHGNSNHQLELAQKSHALLHASSP
jgi:hypothetical protein